MSGRILSESFHAVIYSAFFGENEMPFPKKGQMYMDFSQ